MLQCVKPEVAQVGCLRVPIDAKDSAHAVVLARSPPRCDNNRRCCSDLPDEASDHSDKLPKGGFSSRTAPAFLSFDHQTKFVGVGRMRIRILKGYLTQLQQRYQ